jgi:hypothetical protein
MTLDASGNLLVGTTTSLNSQAGRGLIELNGSSESLFSWKRNNTDQFYIHNYSTGVDVWNTANTFIRFATNNTERARITAGGYSKFSNDGTYVGSTNSYHEFRSSAADYVAYITNTNATTPSGFHIKYTAAAPNGTGSLFLAMYDNASGDTLRAAFRSNGGLVNYQANNVDLSDARTKKEINPASSMWNKIGALEIVTYKYNDQTHDDVNVGVIAQQVESVEPVWVDNDGFGKTPEGEEPLKTVYTKDIYFAAIKALQEAMARIEQLETKVAALESK